MKEANLSDAESVARFLNLKKETVWEIIKGMHYSTLSDLALEVQKAISISK